MKDAFLGEQEAGTHLYAGGAHEERCRDAAAVNDAAGCYDRDLNFRNDISIRDMVVSVPS